VAPYDTRATADPFAASRKSFEALLAEPAGETAAELRHDRLEELVDERGREVLRLLFQDHLDLRALREERQHDVAGPRAVVGRRRAERGHERQLATVVGTVVVRRMAHRAPGRANVYPADAQLSLPVGRHSLGLRKLAVLEAVRGSYDAARAAIRRRCGPVAGKRQVEDLVRAAAVDVAAFYAQRTAPPCTAQTPLVLSADGKGIVMRPDALRPPTAKAAAGKPRGRGVFRTRLASGEKPCRKRMATLACVYDAKAAPRRPHDVIEVPGGRSGEREVRSGPKAQGKWLVASVEQSAGEVIAAAFDQAEDRDPLHARCWVVLVDGDRHQIELIEAEAARRKVPVHIVVDLVHVLQYVWSAAWCLFARNDPAAEDWVAARALAVLRGRSQEVARGITGQAEAHGLTDDRRTGADACARYLQNKEEYLHYDAALEAGWPVASGVIEGAARHLIADRFDITGSRWSVPGAEAVLTLRAVQDNGDFPAYWAFHTEREHHRVHQAHYQEGYDLTA
jgi:hypothetical protein